MLCYILFYYIILYYIILYYIILYYIILYYIILYYIILYYIILYYIILYYIILYYIILYYIILYYIILCYQCSFDLSILLFEKLSLVEFLSCDTGCGVTPGWVGLTITDSKDFHENIPVVWCTALGLQF